MYLYGVLDTQYYPVSTCFEDFSMRQLSKKFIEKRWHLSKAHIEQRGRGRGCGRRRYYEFHDSNRKALPPLVPKEKRNVINDQGSQFRRTSSKSNRTFQISERQHNQTTASHELCGL